MLQYLGLHGYIDLHPENERSKKTWFIWIKKAKKNGDNIYFIITLYVQSLNLKSKNNSISLNLNESNNCYLYSLKLKI